MVGIKAQMNGQEVAMITDSGSQISIIDSLLVNKNWQTKDVKTKVRGISNNVLE